MTPTSRPVSLPIGATLWTVAALVIVVAARVRAHVDELALDVGGTMLHHPATDQSDPPRSLLVNGLVLHVASGGTPAPLPDVLDVFHARCRERAGRLDETFEGRRGIRARLERLAPLPVDGVLRLEDDARGYVACLDMGGVPLRTDELLRRGRAALAEGDVALFGDLRFVFATRAGGRTSYLALWTDGPLPLLRALPAQGDAPGVDLPDVPRPSGTQRALSAHEQEGRALIAVYRAPGDTAAALAARYRAQLRRAGFVLPAEGWGNEGFVAHRGDTWIAVALTADGADALASIVPL